MRITTRLNLTMFTLFVVLVAVGSFLSYQRQRSLVRAVVRNNTRILAGEVIAELARSTLPPAGATAEGSYHDSESLQNLVNSISMRDKYLIRVISATAAKGRFSASAPVAAQMRQMIARGLQETDIVSAEEGKQYLVYLRDVPVTPQCLGCHGSRASAPPAIRDAYAEGDPVFGHREGEHIGAVEVRVPMHDLVDDVWVNVRGDIIQRAITLLLIVGATTLVLRRYVVDPLLRVTKSLEKVAKNDLVGRMECENLPEEIDGMVRAMNELIERVAFKTEQFRESEEHYRRVVELSQIPVVTMTGEGKIVMTNPAAEKLLLFEKHELQGMDFFSFIVRNDSFRKQFVSRFADRGPGHTESLAAELDLRDGRYYAADITFTRLETRTPTFLARIRKAGASDEDLFG